MRLAILIGHFPPDAVGGAELQAQAWARRLAARHDVVVVTRFSAPAHAARERRDGYEVVRLRPARLPGWRTVHDLLSIERAVRALPRRPDLLLCFQTFISGFAGIRIQRHTGIPAVVWVRGEGEVRLARSPLARWVGPRVWEAARGVLVQSEAVRTTLLAELERVAPRLRAGLPGKLEVVPNGLELPDPPFTRGGRVLTVGRLIRDKGMDTVIDAVAGVQGLLTLAGEGAERAALEARAKRHGLDARFEGVVDRGRLERLYREAACVVLAARRGEGLPNALLEAMAFARPVVATPVAGVRDLVRDGVNGLLVPPDDPRALRDALARLQSEKGLAARLAAAARETAEGFAWDRVQPRLEAVLERWAAA